MEKFTAEVAENAEMLKFEELNKVSEIIIGSAIKVHRSLGPGLLESAYQVCLNYEMIKSGLIVESEKPIPIVYGNVKLDCGYRLDFLINSSVVVEIKSMEKILPIHKAQILFYLKLTECSLGLLINFNVSILTQGLVRVVNNLENSAPSAFSAVQLENKPVVGEVK